MIARARGSQVQPGTGGPAILAERCHSLGGAPGSPPGRRRWYAASVTSVRDSSVDRAALSVPTYELGEVARLVGLDRPQVSRWLFGYSYRYRDSLRSQDPLMARHLDAQAIRQASFLDLVELRAAKLFLDRGLSPQKVRRAFSEAESVCGAYPFARHRLYAVGPRLFLELEGDRQGVSNLLELQTGGQWVIQPMMRRLLEQLDFDEQSGLACAWWPLGRKKPVLITPSRAFGAPTLKKHNIRTANVYDLYLAGGRNLAPVARWFGISQGEVAVAVSYEEGLHSTAA